MIKNPTPSSSGRTARAQSRDSSNIHLPSVGEIRTKIISVSGPNDSSIEEYLSDGGVIYPNVKIPYIDEEDVLALRSNKEMLLKNSKPEPSSVQLLPDSIQSAVDYVYSSKYMFEKWALTVPPLQWAFSARNEELEDRLEVIADYKNTPARAFDWHSSLFRFAVALQDQCIYFFDLSKLQWSPQVLRHDFHRDIRVIRYKPYPESSTTLAVGCEIGVCIWELNQRLTMFYKQNVQPNALRDETQNGVCTFLKTDYPVTSLEWFPNPSSSQKLVTASELDHRLTVWSFDADRSKWSSRTLSRTNGAIRGISFSPNGKYLAVFTNTNVFRIWDTNSWESEKWSSFDDPVQSYAWSANSRFLLISTVGSSSICVIRFDDRSTVAGEFCYDIDLSVIQNDKNPQETLIVRSFALDHEGGQRLVVAFENSDSVAVFRCDFDSYATKNPVYPIGEDVQRPFLKGPQTGESAHYLQFWPGFRKGALLSCVWKSGKIGFYPLYYSSTSYSEF